uniref:Uncharacterized protein n=1 Tax=Timema bartmani TaxID=61472 RepID=A0A7R9FCB0_9NEOP|nr:unnamed protein product [Timema bartmani]
MLEWERPANYSGGMLREMATVTRWTTIRMLTTGLFHSLNKKSNKQPVTCPVASAIYGFHDLSVFVGVEGYFGLLLDGLHQVRLASCETPYNRPMGRDLVYPMHLYTWPANTHPSDNPSSSRLAQGMLGACCNVPYSNFYYPHNIHFCLEPLWNIQREYSKGLQPTSYEKWWDLQVLKSFCGPEARLFSSNLPCTANKAKKGK